MAKYYLGIDQGTTGTTVLLIDENWDVVSRGYKEHTQIYPKPGWVEHDPEEILSALIEATRQAISGCPECDPKDIVSVGIDNQGETCMAWDRRTGKPIYNAIVWQDRRTSGMIDSMISEEDSEYIRKVTGKIPDAYYSASKIAWILENVEEAGQLAKEGNLCAGTTDAFLIFRLTGGKAFVTDAATANLTMLENAPEGRWDERILDVFGIPMSILPEINDCSHIYGNTDPEVFLGLDIPIGASLADAYAALAAQGCLDPGDIKATYGTGCFMTMVVGKDRIIPANGLASSMPYQFDGVRTFALSGSIYMAGAAINWLRDGLGIIGSPQETETLAKSVPDTKGVYFVPAFTGLAAPWWDQYARGTIVGLTAAATKPHIVRSVLEAIAYQVCDNMQAFREAFPGEVKTLKVDGGPVDNEFLMQFQADMLGSPIEVPTEKETTAYGSAFLAALAAGEFEDIRDVKKCLKLKKRYEPSMSEDERQYRMDMWHKAVARSRNWAKEAGE